MTPASRRIFLLFCLAALLNGAAAYWLIPPPVLTRDAGVAAWESRLEPLKRALPAAVRVLGYISDLDLLENPTQSELFNEIDELPLTQYSLAPLLVRPGLDEEWLIGNFTRPGMKNYLDTHLPAGYEIQSFGFGIYLIHRSPSPPTPLPAGKGSLFPSPLGGGARGEGRYSS